MNCSRNNSLLKKIDATLDKKKIYFQSTLSDGTQNALQRLDYSSSPIIFSWQNDKDVPVYIHKYIFCYEDNNNQEPEVIETYHGTAWSSKIGAVNSDGDDFEEPYIEYKSNLWYTNDIFPKRTNWSDTGWHWRYEFNEAPIEIGVSRKFGHYIAGNFDTTDYDSDPLGIIEGYYYTD